MCNGVKEETTNVIRKYTGMNENENTMYIQLMECTESNAQREIYIYKWKHLKSVTTPYT